jgi:hypothetical protein
VLGLVGYAGWNLWEQSKAVAAIKKQASDILPQKAQFDDHKSRWRELAPLVDQDQWPVETLYRISLCMPPQKGVIRFSEASINNNEIRIKGIASQPTAFGQFNFAINKSEDLTRRFKFTSSPPNNTSKGVEFVLQGAVPQEAQ